jgi:hypothetical protein
MWLPSMSTTPLSIGSRPIPSMSVPPVIAIVIHLFSHLNKGCDGVEEE